MKIIIDAMGGDNAPQAPVMGAIQANKEYGVDIILVGRGEEILKVLKENGIEQLPAGVQEVGNWAFADCPSLRVVGLPDGLDYLGGGAFACCTDL